MIVRRQRRLRRRVGSLAEAARRRMPAAVVIVLPVGIRRRLAIQQIVLARQGLLHETTTAVRARIQAQGISQPGHFGELLLLGIVRVVVVVPSPGEAGHGDFASGMGARLDDGPERALLLQVVVVVVGPTRMVAAVTTRRLSG